MSPRVLQATMLLEFDRDPRSAVLLMVPAILVVIVSARLKQKEKLRRHQQTLAATREKMLSK